MGQGSVFGGINFFSQLTFLMVFMDGSQNLVWMVHAPELCKVSGFSFLYILPKYTSEVYLRSVLPNYIIPKYISQKFWVLVTIVFTNVCRRFHVATSRSDSPSCVFGHLTNWKVIRNNLTRSHPPPPPQEQCKVSKTG